MYIFNFVKKRVKTSMFTSEHDIVLLCYASKYITDNDIDMKFGPDVIKKPANSRKYVKPSYGTGAFQKYFEVL